MSGITVVSTNPSLETSLLALYGKQTAVRRVWSDQWTDPTETAMDVCAADPEMVVIGSDVNWDDVRSLIPEIDVRYPGVATVTLVQTRDPALESELFRLGARDVIAETPVGEDLKRDLDRVFDRAIQRRQTAAVVSTGLRRRVISVLSPKGGTGKTTVATNVAVALARRLPNQVLLLDLDTQFGDCAPALSLQPEHSLADVIGSSAQERSALKVFLTTHPSSLAVLAPPDDLALAEEIGGDDLKRSLSVLVEEFPFVIIDTAAGINPEAISAMEASTDFLFVSTTDVPSIRALRRQIDALDRVGFVSQRRTFVLNRANAKVGLSVADVEAAIGMKAEFEIPSTRLVPVSTNEGIPLVERETGGVSRRFADIASYYAPEQGRNGRTLFRNRKNK